MGASSSSLRTRRASIDLASTRHQVKVRSASGTFIKAGGGFLMPRYPTPISPDGGGDTSPRPVRSSVGTIQENDFVTASSSNQDVAVKKGGGTSRFILGKLGRRRRTRTSPSAGSISMIDDGKRVEEHTRDGTMPIILKNGSQLDVSNESASQCIPHIEISNRDTEADDVFLDAVDTSRPRLLSADSFRSDVDQSGNRVRSETLVYRGEMVEKAVQTEHAECGIGVGVDMPCKHCERRCSCYGNAADPFDSNSSTQSLRVNEEKSKRRRRRWSPLIGRRQMTMNRMSFNAKGSRGNTTYHHQSLPHMRPLQRGRSEDVEEIHSLRNDGIGLPLSTVTSPKKWSIRCRSKRRRRRACSEDQDSPVSSQCSEISICSQRSFLEMGEPHPSDNVQQEGLYTCSLSKSKRPLEKNTVPVRRQTWSEKSRHTKLRFDQKKGMGFLNKLRHLRSSCSEADINLEPRGSVDSTGYVDPFYISKNFNRLNRKRLSLSYPDLNHAHGSFRGSISSPGSLKGRVSAAVELLERALTGRRFIDRSHSVESQHSTSTGWNSDLPGSPTDSEAAVYSFKKAHHHQRNQQTLYREHDNGYMIFDPDMNPPIQRPRLLSSSCSSVPSSPGFYDGSAMTAFDDVPSTCTTTEQDSIYETLDNYNLLKQKGTALQRLPSSDGETPPEVPPRPPSHRVRYRQRMLRRQLPLPPIPIAQNTQSSEDNSTDGITVTNSTGNLNSAIQSYRSSCRRNNFISKQSSSCSTLQYLRQDSSEGDYQVAS